MATWTHVPTETIQRMVDHSSDELVYWERRREQARKDLTDYINIVNRHKVEIAEMTEELRLRKEQND